MKKLPAQWVLARQERLKTNQGVSCPECPKGPPLLAEGTVT